MGDEAMVMNVVALVALVEKCCCSLYEKTLCYRFFLVLCGEWKIILLWQQRTKMMMLCVILAWVFNNAFILWCAFIMRSMTIMPGSLHQIWIPPSSFLQVLPDDFRFITPSCTFIFHAHYHHRKMQNEIDHVLVQIWATRISLIRVSPSPFSQKIKVIPNSILTESIHPSATLIRESS